MIVPSFSLGHAEEQEKDQREPAHKSGSAYDDPSSETSSHSMEMGDMSDTGCTDDEETGLTHEARKKRRRRRRSGARLDERVAPLPLSKTEEKKLADLAVLKRSGVNVLLIGLWYVGECLAASGNMIADVGLGTYSR